MRCVTGVLPLALGILIVACSAVQAGKNAGGAMVVHTDDAYAWTNGICAKFDDWVPQSCDSLTTRTDKDEYTPALIWFVAAFPDTSNPGVTVAYFGIDHNLPQYYIDRHGYCGPSGTIEVRDAGWPDDTDAGNSVAFGSAVTGDRLFPFYWFSAYGFRGAYLGTAANPTGGYATFVDDSNPPIQDEVTSFGTVRWYAAGSNDCPSGAMDGGEEGGEEEGGGEEETDQDPGGEEWENQGLDGDGERQWVANRILARLSDEIPMLPREPVERLGITSFDELGQQLGIVGVRRLLILSDEACSQYPVGSHLVEIALGAGSDEKETAARFWQLPEVVWALPDYVHPDEVFGDTYDHMQWYLDPPDLTSCRENPAECCDECDIGVDTAWQYTRGNPNVIVAFMDTGADMQQPDLFDAYLVNWGEDDGDGVVELCAAGFPFYGDIDGDDDDGNGVADDILLGWNMEWGYRPYYWRHLSNPAGYDHGTRVAGILGALTNNDVGISSVAGGDWETVPPRPGISLIQFSRYERVTSSGAINSFYYAERYGASVYSSSVGLSVGGSCCFDDGNCWEGWTEEECLAAGHRWVGVPDVIQKPELANSMLFILAAGNGGGTPFENEFARVNGVMAVGGYDHTGNRWITPAGWGSDYGPNLSVLGPTNDSGDHDAYPRMVMASTGHVSSDPEYTCSPPSGDPYVCFGGTSAAAPVVASVAALIFSYSYEQGLGLTPAQVRKIIERSAEDIQCDPAEPGCECDDPDESCATKLLGWDQYTGYGRVDAGRAFTLPIAALELEPYEDFVIWGGRVHLSWEVFDLDPLSGSSPHHLALHYWIPESGEGWQVLDDYIALDDPPYFDWNVPIDFPLGDYRYFRLSVLDSEDQVLNQDYRRFSVEVTTDAGEVVEDDTSVSVQSIAPNPASKSTRIRYVLRMPADVDVRVYDVAGRYIKTLAHGRQEAGPWVLDWDGRDDSDRHVASGIYFIRLKLGSHAKTERLVLVQ